jgi:hypothetical protein
MKARVTICFPSSITTSARRSRPVGLAAIVSGSWLLGHQAPCFAALGEQTSLLCVPGASPTAKARPDRLK